MPEKPSPFRDLILSMRSAWEKGEPIKEGDEGRLCEILSKPENLPVLVEISDLAASGAAEEQQARLLAAGKPAIEAICQEAIRDAHEHAQAATKTTRKNAKARLKISSKAISQLAKLSAEFPEIKSVRDAVSISLNQPFLANGKVDLACALIEQKKGMDALKSISPHPNIVTGIFARERIGQLLTSNGLDAETAQWAVCYLGDCIRRAPPEKRAQAIILLLDEASNISLARKSAITEAASIASRIPYADYKYISKKIHSISRKAAFGTSDKALFLDFAKEFRRHVDDPVLFPITIEERRKAGGRFNKDTTLIMSGFHAALDAEEKAAEAGAHALKELAEELEKPKESENKPAEELPSQVQPLSEDAQKYPPGITVKELLARMEEDEQQSGPAFPSPSKKLVAAIQRISTASTEKRRKAAFQPALAILSEGKKDYSHHDFIKDLSPYIRYSADAEENSFSIQVAEALISLSAMGALGPIESAEAQRIIASASPVATNQALLNKINHGSKSEGAHALLILAERARINRGTAEEGAGIYETALMELVKMGPASAIPSLFSLSEQGCPSGLLLEFLRSYGPNEAGEYAIRLLLRAASEEPGALFAKEAKERHKEKVGKQKAELAVRLLDVYGGGEAGEMPSQGRVAKALATIGTPEAVELLLQGLDDSVEDDKGVWKDGIRSVCSSGPSLAKEVESKIISKFSEFSPLAQEIALDLLAENPSLAQARFLFSLASEGKGRLSALAEMALASYDFSCLSNAERFEIMRMMHASGMPPGKGATLLKEFIPSHSSSAEEWMNAAFLSSLAESSEDRELAKMAMDCLLAHSEKALSSRHGYAGLGGGEGAHGILEALSSSDAEVRALAIYALASRMAAEGNEFSPAFHRLLYQTSAKLKKEGNEAAILCIISAARAASSEEAMRQVLVPYLAAGKRFSTAAAKALLSTEMGARQLALAAAMENHPRGVSKEGSLKISQNAFQALAEAGTEFSSRALVSLLKNKKSDLHLSAYEALSNAGDSKYPALLELLSSQDPWEKYAAIKLLPPREDFARAVLPLCTDADRCVSSSAMEYVLSSMGARGLSSLLSDASIQEEIQQALSTYCIKNRPRIAKEIAELAQGEGKAAEEAIYALEFFPPSLSFPALLGILDSSKSTKAAARDALVQICWLLSASSGEDLGNAAGDLLKAYASTSDPQVRSAIVDAARGALAEPMLNAALKDASHALSALQIFTTIENVPYAAKIAQSIIRDPPPQLAEAKAPPALWQVLFLRDFSKMAGIAPGSAECKILQEVAEQEFLHGQGSIESRELIFAFMKHFGGKDVRDSLFEKGPLAVSEFLWSIREDESREKAILWLRSMKDEKTNILLDVLVSNDYSALDQAIEDKELFEAVLSHATRRALLSFAELSKGGPEAEAAAGPREGLELYSQLFSRDKSISLPSMRGAEFRRLRKNLGLAGLISEEGIARGERMIIMACESIRELSLLRTSARGEARRLSKGAGEALQEAKTPSGKVRRPVE